MRSLVASTFACAPGAVSAFPTSVFATSSAVPMSLTLSRCVGYTFNATLSRGSMISLYTAACPST